ncbi:MAG: hypothetical protein HZC11_00915 [Nitrospirae bacterium]|nr:hypothetical protein [Nitrospirota bacterium]
MISNSRLLKKFEDDFIKDKGRLPFELALKLFTSLWHEGVKLGSLPPKDPLEGIEVDIRIAKALNLCLKSYSPK